MLPTIPIAPRRSLTSRSLFRNRFALSSYRFGRLAFICFFRFSTYTTSAAIATKLTPAAITAGIARRIPITGSPVFLYSSIFFRVNTKQHDYAEAGGGK